MKRYIFFCAALDQGGAQRVISILSKQLAEQGKNVEILLYYKQELFYDIDERVKITSVEGETHSRNLICNLFWMRKYFRNHAELVCSFLSSFNMLALVATRGLGIPIIVSERTDPLRKPWVYRQVRDFLYGFADALVTQTEISRAYFAARTKSRCVTIDNPISPQLHVGAALSTSKEPVIVSVGRLEPVKNQALLIRSFKRVKNRFPQYKLIFYGEGACRNNLERLRDELDLQDAVEFAGEVHDIFEHISVAEVFVLSSDFEGMTNALLEAMCLGLPVISTKVSGAIEIIENGYNGLLVETKDEQGLADSIVKSLEDKNLRYKLAKNAVKLASRLDIESVVFAWNEVVEVVMENNKG